MMEKFKHIKRNISHNLGINKSAVSKCRDKLKQRNATFDL
jgi:hypothetical protein